MFRVTGYMYDPPHSNGDLTLSSLAATTPTLGYRLISTVRAETPGYPGYGLKRNGVYARGGTPIQRDLIGPVWPE